MSFGKSRTVHAELSSIIESGVHLQPEWYKTGEYGRTFKRVWNCGKEFYVRCIQGKTPSRKDFDIFYQEGIFENVMLPYQGKSLLRENTPGFKLKSRMKEKFGK